MLNEKTINSAVLLIGGILVGAGTGYILAKKFLEKEYSEHASAEIASVREMYRKRYKEGAYAAPKSTVAELIPEGESPIEQGEEPDDDTNGEALQDKVLEFRYVEEVVKPYPTFVSVPGEIPIRKPRPAKSDGPPEPYIDKGLIPTEVVAMPVEDKKRPYVITLDEFMEDDEMLDEPFAKVCIVYYEADDTLADEQDNIIPDVEMTVGKQNLTRFGLGSRDENIVYVRNWRHMIDYEIAREEGSYTRMVLGETENFLQHHDKPPIRRMKDGWDTR